MKQYIKTDEWNIIEEGFHPEDQRLSESIFSIGNGHMGQRANFEEAYSGDSLQGSYMAGVYYTDKTKVGWWKNGYPEYFAKVLNATNWIGINIVIDGESLDLAKCQVKEFRRVLNMKEGFLHRTLIARLPGQKEIRIDAKRFVSMTVKEAGLIRYSITPLNFDGECIITPYLDGDVKNTDSNYDEKFWTEVHKENSAEGAVLTLKTKKLNFRLCSLMKYDLLQGGEKSQHTAELIEKEKYVGCNLRLTLKQSEETVLYKYVINVTSRDKTEDELIPYGKSRLEEVYQKGFDAMLREHSAAWSKKWNESDIAIEGDMSAQQAIRFNIFQLNQTYTGEDERLNIGPKGFTGEKYGGSTYWDTEAYCLPFYLSTADQKIPRNLLIYRYKHLEKAKENAAKLGFPKGALYPMVTMNGEECHNEWEITFEEIHRNGAIAYAVYNYVNYTGDRDYLKEYGLEVLIELSRFWEERVNFSKARNSYVILGVTGPNEYENNVNNNWYTNRIASWTLEYTLEVINRMKADSYPAYKSLEDKLSLKETELVKWMDIIKHMYYPVDEERDIFLQQDGYLDKEQCLVRDLDKQNLPLNQHWSWDRILRSCFIKQADVLQGLYFLQDKYDLDTIRRNFNFYEPRTVHESSLSPCIHAILAAKLKDKEKAYGMYLKTARLDLDNYNNDTEDGCHITSMAGTWMSVVEGFGGMRVVEEKLCFHPVIPDNWKSFSFRIKFRGNLIKATITKDAVIIKNENGQKITLSVNGTDYTIDSEKAIQI
ncbi:glycoside hydrolase family 65 protein [Anaerocolumna xylanovorans]|uniref:Maltose phosphorylase n=1 Tax=Anaerocolumna xylanovorans DSM 12503 TaxID=1121345 RepID=A0A1M7Y9I2_9FIRM|nr:glycoside hydrolase family 65 protein [Anaerocolumna xylanovorans]SHO49277.1 maltose phosphorylase [Anaerocolumna xylanovorans DSM 12503]